MVSLHRPAPSAARAVAWAGLLLLAGAASARADLTLSVSGDRLVSDGRPLRLVGYSDAGILAERAFDFRAFFDRSLVPNRINYIRVWATYAFANDLTPFAGSRSARYNLLRPNPAFYARLEDLVLEANARNIVVHFTFFDGCGFDSGARDPYRLRWANSPYNIVRNLQGFLTAPGQFDDLGTRCWNEVNLPLIRAVADRIGRYGNVIYEPLNEPNIHGGDNDNLDFQRAIVTELRRRLDLYGGSKVISVNLPSDRRTRDWAFADARIGMVSYHLGPTESPASSWARDRKAVLVSNDGHNTMSRSLLADGSRRAALTADLLRRTYDNGAPVGKMHFDFLDKDLNRPTWKSQDYNPRAANADAAILATLARWAR